MLFFTSVFVYKLHLTSPFIKQELIGHCVHFPLIIRLIVRGRDFVSSWRLLHEKWMIGRGLMKRSYSTLICHVLLFKGIWGLIRKIACFALSSCKCMSKLTLSVVQQPGHPVHGWWMSTGCSPVSLEEAERKPLAEIKTIGLRQMTQ